MDGHSQTDIVTLLGRKYGSAVGSLPQAQENHEEENNVTNMQGEVLQPDCNVHFPFAGNENLPSVDIEAKVSADTIIATIKAFDTRVEEDSFFLSHLHIQVKESVKEVLNMKAKLETNRAVHEDLSRSVAPFEFGEGAGDGATLERKKYDDEALKHLLGGEELIQAGKKKRKQSALPRPKIGCSQRNPRGSRSTERRQSHCTHRRPRC
ncbi:hypothetical protein R1sor_009006 [Riccia sorocarpa]|uniref:Uncharacterized protein n=1 Tax=Riccia sorocarpa TaxID=122646 RepID=A0ABD3H4I9_9MARC